MWQTVLYGQTLMFGCPAAHEFVVCLLNKIASLSCERILAISSKQLVQKGLPDTFCTILGQQNRIYSVNNPVGLELVGGFDDGRFTLLVGDRYAPV